MIDTLTALLQPWADRYAESTLLPPLLLSLHVLGMFVAGGIAIGADRRVLLATPGTAEAHRAAAEDLKAQHGVVIGALVVTVVSGLALAAADVATFAGSLVYWSKMATFAMLLINGAIMRRTEARVVTVAATTMEFSVVGPDLQLPWGALKRSAWISVTGWLVTVVLGVLLTNI